MLFKTGIKIKISDITLEKLQELVDYPVRIKTNFMSIGCIISTQKKLDEKINNFINEFGEDGYLEFIENLTDGYWLPINNENFDNYIKRETHLINRWIQSGGTLD